MLLHRPSATLAEPCIATLVVAHCSVDTDARRMSNSGQQCMRFPIKACASGSMSHSLCSAPTTTLSTPVAPFAQAALARRSLRNESREMMNIGKPATGGMLVLALALVLLATPAASRRSTLTAPQLCPLVLQEALTDCPGGADDCKSTLWDQKCKYLDGSSGATFCFNFPPTTFQLLVKDGKCGSKGRVSGQSNTNGCPFTQASTLLTVDGCSSDNQYGCNVTFTKASNSWSGASTDCKIVSGGQWSSTTFNCLAVTTAANPNCITIKNNCKATTISHVAMGPAKGPCCSCTLADEWDLPTTACYGDKAPATINVTQTCSLSPHGTAPPSVSAKPDVTCAINDCSRNVTYTATDSCGKTTNKTTTLALSGGPLTWYNENDTTPVSDPGSDPKCPGSYSFPTLMAKQLCDPMVNTTRKAPCTTTCGTKTAVYTFTPQNATCLPLEPTTYNLTVTINETDWSQSFSGCSYTYGTCETPGQTQPQVATTSNFFPDNCTLALKFPTVNDACGNPKTLCDRNILIGGDSCPLVYP